MPGLDSQHRHVGQWSQAEDVVAQVGVLQKRSHQRM